MFICKTCHTKTERDRERCATEALRRTEISHHHLAAVDPDADREVDAVPLGHRTQRNQRRMQRNRRLTGLFSVPRLGDRGAVDRHDRVADVLVDEAAVVAPAKEPQ